MISTVPLTLGILRPIKPEELTVMLEWRNSPIVRSNMYTRHEISLEEHLTWWSSVQKREDQQYFMFESNGTGSGIVAFTEIDTINRVASWAFYASPTAPKGTGSKMEFLALEYAFSHLNLHKLCCEVLAFNTTVIKLHEKFGFKVEGILREHHKIDVKFVDIYRLGLLAMEWERHRGEILHRIQNFSKH